MNQNIIVGLVSNAALLLSLGLIYDAFFRGKRASFPVLQQILAGLIIGAVAIVLMLTPVKWENGIIFDTRTILLGLTGLFFGTVPTLLAVAIASVYRVGLGGGGVLMGVATIVSSGLLGLAWRHYRLHGSRELSLFETYLFGGVVHATMILCMFLLPQEVIQRTISSLALPVIIIYPIATALLGNLLSGRQRNYRIRKELAHEKVLFEAIFNGIPDAVIYLDVDREVIAINPAFTSVFGYTLDDLAGKRPGFLYQRQEEYERQGRLLFNLKASKQSLPYEVNYRKKDGQVFPGETLGTVIKSASGSVLGYIRVIRDSTEKKRAEAEIQRYIVQLKTAFMSTVEVATTLSEMRDPYTGGHERRVAEIAVAIGVELGWDEHRREGLHVAGHLHDIGKITIPAEILSKPGALSSIEYQLIQGHARASYEVLKMVEFPWPVAEVALQHHERMDGSGYPRGLKGEAIMIEARILAVADVVEAMASHRPYRDAHSIDKALAEIERGRATLYDPVVVDACLKLFREQGYTTPT